MKPLASALIAALLSLGGAANAMDLDQAVDQVLRDNGGRVLSADTESGVHRIKILTPDRRVRVIQVEGGRDRRYDRGRDDDRRDFDRGRDRDRRDKDRRKDRGRDRDR